MPEKYANVIVDITHERLDKVFQYKIPSDMEERIQAGTAVWIPFGQGNRKIKGYVIAITDNADYPVAKIKALYGIASSENAIEENMVALAVWMHKNYGSTLIQSLKTVLPVKQKVKEKQKRFLRLAISHERAEAFLQEYINKHYTAKSRFMAALLDEQLLSYDLAVKKLNISTALVKSFQEQNIIEIEYEQIYRNPVSDMGKEDQIHVLNEEQQHAADYIYNEWSQGIYNTYLLHGITGSGKTEVYIELIARAVAAGKQSIVLIPEIALTYQTVMRFYRRFGNKVSIMNSRLSKGERYDQFERAKRGEIDVMIGPRSALFTPFPNLGFIIIDEEHENSYKSEQVPRYHARETAIQRARMQQASVVLGSATPSVDSYYRCEAGEYQLLTLKKRAGEFQLPTVYTVDLRQELKEGNRSIISRQLHSLIEDRLKKKQQIMLFLNRRGYAGFLSCRSCGQAIKCPHCDVSLTIHKNNRLVCHYCGYEQPNINKCPSCTSPFISSFKAGTQQIEELVKKEFPDASVLRMDLDTTKNKDGHEKILSAFSNHEADILIGTQMIVKGHDFPLVTLVGVLAADMSLNDSDYRAAERTFQLLTQAVGRAGRGNEKGEAVIQTYNPDHYSIQTSAVQDYIGFYNQEILYRQLMKYPPAANLLAIHVAGKDEGYADMAVSYLKQYIAKIYKQDDLVIIGPADERVAKVNDIYKKILYLKHNDNDILIKIKDVLEKFMDVNEGYSNVNVQFDFNPMS